MHKEISDNYFFHFQKYEGRGIPLNRHIYFGALKFFCIAVFVVLFSGICLAAAKPIQPTLTPDKPAAGRRGTTKKAEESERRGRVQKEEPVIRVGLSDGQMSTIS